MDRFPNAEFPDDPDPTGRIPHWQQDIHDAAALRGEDDYLTDRIDQDGLPTEDPSGLLVDRRDREHVAYYQTAEGAWKPLLLKRGDHVICAGLPLVVVGPGSHRTVFSGMYAPWLGDNFVLPIEASYITDRAPADPTEDPMPIIPDEVEP